MGQAVADMFGYHALQMGLPALDGLQHNRMPHRWLAAAQLPAPTPALGVQTPACASDAAPQAPPADLVTDFAALPFPPGSIDLVLLPHALELCDAHATLREVERVLVAEGRVVVCGFNPLSLWSLRRQRQHLWRLLGLGRWVGADYLPYQDTFLGVWRLRDWLRLLGFEVEEVRYGCYSPAVGSQVWLKRFDWLNRLGQRWWPILGAAYMVVAVKKVRGARLMGAAWKATPVRAAKPAVAGQRRQEGVNKEKEQ